MKFRLLPQDLYLDRIENFSRPGGESSFRSNCSNDPHRYNTKAIISSGGLQSDIKRIEGYIEGLCFQDLTSCFDADCFDYGCFEEEESDIKGYFET
jgi:hypothetical protein